ncbi:MAG: type II/IV secretion system protein [Rhodocyclaceae bacterium]|nr:type II/IV secretion system protein [Rhodocyclaceae bacterium]
MQMNRAAELAPEFALDPTAIAAAVEASLGSDRGAVELLEESVGLPPADFVEQLAVALRYRVADSAELNRAVPLFERLAFTECQSRNCIVLRLASGEDCLVLADPLDRDLAEWADLRFAGLERRIAHHADLGAYLGRFEDNVRALEALGTSDPQRTDGADDDGEVLSLARISEDASVVVKLVNSTIYDALKAQASDIHLEMAPSGLQIKYRVDGVLNAAGSVSGVEQAEQVISRIKIMAELDIAERRVPQDGRFKVRLKGRSIDFRVSVMPSIHGEDAVLRVLDKQDLAQAQRGVLIDTLGFDGDTRAVLGRLAGEPYGMVLVTGPTGSGKTTTVYAMLSEINNGHDKIITIEDPVEYQLPGVLQIPVNEKKGLTFARGLRSILRHDPDKIMVGEIRDAETAQIAIQSALTGHLVFTTIHANSVFDVIGRFAQMGVDAYSFVAALNGILAQRLVRLVCRDCMRPASPDADALRESGIDPDSAIDFEFVEGEGCGRCRGSGYRGRSAIAEILQLDDELRQLIIDRAPIGQIKASARRKGTRLLRESAVDLVRAGRSTLAEINRVTFVSK